MKMYAYFTTTGFPIWGSVLCEEHRESTAGLAIAEAARDRFFGIWDGNEELVEVSSGVAREGDARCQICGHSQADTPDRPIEGSEDELENLRTTVREDAVVLHQQAQKITDLMQQLDDARSASAKAWAAYLGLMLDQRMEDGTPLVVEVFRHAPNLATRFRSALGLMGSGE